MCGKDEGSKRILHPDVKEHSIAEAPGYVEVTKWAGLRLLESIGMKNGKVIGRDTDEVSDDGTTLTAKLKGVDARGKAFEQTIVFDRAEPM